MSSGRILLRAVQLPLLIISLLAFVQGGLSADSEWYWSHPLPVGNHIVTSYFTDSENGWVATPFEIYRTSDGGSSWEEVWSVTPSWYDITSIFFLDNLEGWACGLDGLILHTSDGGVSWTEQVSGTNEDLSSVQFTDADYGTVVGDGGTIIRTNNGGGSWYPQGSPWAGGLSDVFFVDAVTGWIAGPSRYLLYTETAGAFWDLQFTGTDTDYNGLWFEDAQTGWAAGDESIIASTDGGDTWVEQYSGSLDFTDICFANLSVGVASYAGGAAHTTDGGQNWTFETMPSYQYGLSSISCPATSTAFTAGNMGLIFRRTEGSGWEMMSSHLTVEDLAAICFVYPGLVWCCGNDGGILHSSDDGESWITQEPPQDVYRLADIRFIDASNGYACGWTSTYEGRVIRTQNGGVTWEDVTPPFLDLPRLSSLDFCSPDCGVVVGNVGEVVRTFDGGETWTRLTGLTEEGLSTVRFGDSDHGWAVGEDGTVLRFDFSADSWSQQFSSTPGTLHGLFALNADTAWAVGWNGTVIRTWNAGDNWYKIAETGDDYRDVWFFDGNSGYLSEFGGGICIASNGGSYIGPLNTVRDDFVKCFWFLDQDNGWGCGNDGRILRFGDGPSGVPEQEHQGLPFSSSFLRVGALPNPFDASATVFLDLPGPGAVLLRLYDVSGRLVDTIFDDELPRGEHSLFLDGIELPPGVYFLRLEWGGQISTSSCVKLR